MLPLAVKPLRKHRRTGSIFIMGLGNPGALYSGTRHNAGYQAVDIVMHRLNLSFNRHFFSPRFHVKSFVDEDSPGFVFLRWPGFMNHSGSLIPQIQRKYSFDVSKFFAVVDNMDLPPGQCRLKRNGGDAGHNGLKSLISAFGSNNFNRLYIGIGRPGKEMSVIDYVLGRPESDTEDGKMFQKGCLKAADAIEGLRTRRFESVAEVVNRR